MTSPSAPVANHIVDANKMVTAPVAMPSVEEIARLLMKLFYDQWFATGQPALSGGVYWDFVNGSSAWTPQARALLALFAPILAEKERRDALDREQADTVRFLQKHLDNPQPPSEALKKLFAGVDSPFNACCHRDECKALEARALAAEAENASLLKERAEAVTQALAAESALSELRMQMLADEGQARTEPGRC